MNETENNTSGGPGTEAKGPHVLDFNGTEIRPGLWAVDDAEIQRIGNAAYQAGRGEREAGIAQLREALDLASQQQAKIAAALGLEPGEDVLAAVSELARLRAEVVKSLGFNAEAHFVLALNRHIDDEVERRAGRIDDEVERRAGRIDAARLRAVAELKQREAEHAAALRTAVEAAETRTRKTCADQINAAQVCIDRATKEHEEERSKLYARIAEVEKQRDEAVEALRRGRESFARTGRLRGGFLLELKAILGAAPQEDELDAARRVVQERNDAVEARDRTLAQVTALQNEEIRLRHAETIEALRRAREYLKDSDERWGRFALNLRTILGAHHAEETLAAASRVVSERDALKAKACTCDTMFRHQDLSFPPACPAPR